MYNYLNYDPSTLLAMKGSTLMMGYGSLTPGYTAFTIIVQGGIAGLIVSFAIIQFYYVGFHKTKEQDSIAYYWDDNSLVSEHKGHLTYATKKTTPVGHWMGITAIVCGTSNKNEMVTAKVFALTSSAIFDAFIACWDEKYRSKMVRPITVIREHIESEWNAF